MNKPFGRRAPALALVCSLALAALLITAGCSSCSKNNPTPQPTPPQNFVSANGAFTVGGQPTTMMINISGTTRAARPASGLLHVGVNTFIQMAGTYNPDGNEIALQDTGGTNTFVGQVAGTTINGTFSEGATQTQITLAATDIPIEAALVLGPWDFTHSFTIEASTKGVVDNCAVPAGTPRTITAACNDRYQVQINGNNIPADACGGTCLPDLELATGTLDGSTLTIFIPEVGESTQGRIATLQLAGCNVAITGDVEIDFLAETTKLVNVDTECIGAGGECDTYCTNGKLDPDCLLNYQLSFTRCEGGSCACR